MKIKVFTHSLKVSIDDDIEKSKEFLTRKIKDFEISFDVEETSLNLVEVPQKLMMPLDGKYDIVMYIFDRFDQNYHNSLAFPLSPTLCGVYIQTTTFDDVVGGTWHSICHEIIHCCFYKAHALNINLYDPMDVAIVKGKPIPYWNNDDPEAKEGNYALAFQYLRPWWSRIAPKMPVATSNLSKWGMIPELEKKCAQFLIDAKKAGYNLKITQGLRSMEYQQALYDQGRTKPGKIVTNAKPGQSKHNFGKAFDVCFAGKEAYPKGANWKVIGEIGKARGLRWGGDFKSIKDQPHFEI